ncbi:MAG: hypothetical protein P8L32_04450 [Paracoccaceae bacterium]|nr:hypothetical protein [Paracoccaceae bacterium]
MPKWACLTSAPAGQIGRAKRDRGRTQTLPNADSRNAWQNGSDVAVHGLIYGLKNGHIRNLDCSVAAGLSVDPSDPD